MNKRSSRDSLNESRKKWELFKMLLNTVWYNPTSNIKHLVFTGNQHDTEELQYIQCY